MIPRPSSSVALRLGAFVLAACTTAPATPTREAGELSTTSAATTAASAHKPPAPAALEEAARRFGFDALGDGWTWKQLDAKATRFDWSGRPAASDREVLVSFWMPTIGATEARFLPQLVASAAANLTDDNRPCEPFDQPEDFLRVFHVERVITVCFTPSEVYGKGYKSGVLHGIVNKGTLTVVAIFSNGRAGLIPLPEEIGLRAR